MQEDAAARFSISVSSFKKDIDIFSERLFGMDKQLIVFFITIFLAVPIFAICDCMNILRAHHIFYCNCYVTSYQHFQTAYSLVMIGLYSCYMEGKLCLTLVILTSSKILCSNLHRISQVFHLLCSSLFPL